MNENLIISQSQRKAGRLGDYEIVWPSNWGRITMQAWVADYAYDAILIAMNQPQETRGDHER